MNSDLLPDLLRAVEQQLMSPQTRYVSAAFERLRGAGVDEDEAKTQIALCLGEQSDRMIRTKRPFDEAAYRAALEELPHPSGDSEKE